MKISSGLTRYVIGLLLVALGILLLLDNTTAFGVDWSLFGTWWPVLLIAWGLWGVFGMFSGGFRLRIWAVILLLLGVGFQLSELGLWDWDFSQLWPVVIVIVGLYILLGRRGRRGMEARRRNRQPIVIVESSDDGAGTGSRTRVGSGESWRAVFNSIEERYAGQDFRGGEVKSNFGNVTLDLRDAALADGSARLDINLTFGGLHLRVPPSWRVNFQEVSAHFGHVQDNRNQPTPESSDGELNVVGTVTFGNLEIGD